MKKVPYFETPPKVTVSITNTCNLKCMHCYGDCTLRRTRHELTTRQWLDFIDYLVANSVIEIYIEGGEPQLRPDFEKILRRCTRDMMTLVRTHGTLLDAACAKRWRRIGVGRVFVDVMGARPQTHEALTGTPGSFRKSCEAVQHLRAAGIPVDLVIVLNRHNAEELPEYLALAQRLGAERVGILRLYPLGRAKRHWAELALSIHEQQSVLEALRPPPGLGIMQSWHPNNANCCWQAAAVNAYGDSIGCMYLREYVNYGNIRDVPLLETWHNNPVYRLLRSGTVEASCSSCNGNEHTRGGCRSTAYAFHGRWTAPDPYCLHLNKGVDLRVLPARLLSPHAGLADQADS